MVNALEKLERTQNSMFRKPNNPQVKMTKEHNKTDYVRYTTEEFLEENTSRSK